MPRNGLEALGIYEERIVDLSKKNRLLKYPKRGRSIEFETDLEDFQNKYGILEELHIEFPHKEILDQEKQVSRQFFDENGGSIAVSSQIPKTKESGEKLVELLTNLRRETKRKYEEHGLHTLFLTIGRVRWKEVLAGNGSSDVASEWDYDAPLLLIPIYIDEKKNPKKTVIETYLENGDISINKVMTLLLEKQYNARRIDLLGTELSNLPVLVDDLFAQLQQIFSEHKIENVLTKDIKIGQFHFAGQQIYEDLNKNRESMIQNEFIGAICNHTPVKQEGLSIEMLTPDAPLTANSDYNILDADVSQLRVIEKVNAGLSLNVQGPPGTGKSQTIVNIIANLLAREKSILFVCEKQVALKQVLKGLTKRGLDKVCLPLFDHKADKKVFAKNIITDRNAVIRSSSEKNLNYPLLQREVRIKKLQAYAQALGTVVQPLGKKLHWVHAETSKHLRLSPSNVLVWKGSEVLEMNHEKYQQTLAILENITPVFNIATEEKHLHWSNIHRSYFSPDFITKITSALTNLQKLLTEHKQFPQDPVVIESITKLKYFLTFSASLTVIKPLPDHVKPEIEINQLIGVIEQVLPLTEEYIESALQFGKPIKFPINWNVQDVKSPTLVKSEISISLLGEIGFLLKKLGSNIEKINSVFGSLSVENDLLRTSIPDFLKYKKVLLLDPVIQKLRSWNINASLSLALEKIADLNLVYTKINEAKNVLKKWTVITSDIDQIQAIELGDRFKNKYKNFFRFVNPQYRKDRKFITSWCTQEVPVKYSDFLEIIQATSNWLHFGKKFTDLYNYFVKEQIIEGADFDPILIPVLQATIEDLATWLKSENLEKIPEKYILLRELINKNQQADTFFNIIIETHTRIQELAVHFNIEQLSESLTIGNIATFFTIMQSNTGSQLSLYEELAGFILSEEQLPKTIYDLHCDIAGLNLLAKQLKNLREYKLDKLFSFAEPEKDFISEINQFRLLLESLKNVSVLIQALFGREEIVKTEEVNSLLGQLKQQTQDWQRWYETYEKQIVELSSLFENNKSIEQYESGDFQTFSSTLTNLLLDQTGLEKWVNYRKYSYQLKEAGYEWFLDNAKDQKIVNPVSTFAHSLWSQWLGDYYKDKPELREFSLNEQEKIIKEFKRLEEDSFEINAQRVLNLLAPSVNQAKHSDYELVRQSQLQRQHKSIRKLVNECGQQLLSYKPCWMMSPLTLSSYAPYGSIDFDVVIFDEASQMRVEHSLGAIARAKQVVIFGDEKQLPPTSFFDLKSDEEDDEEADGEDYESILHATKEVLNGADLLLSHHYRSKYEDLIAFSNKEIYNGDLVTFPNPHNQFRAVTLEYVPDGVFDGANKKLGDSHKPKRRNIIEAKRVVELCAKQIMEEPLKSLGVIAFSRSQEDAIREALTEFIKLHPELNLSEKLNEDDDDPEAFFIKNLESVQGDERDVIILSVGYGRDSLGNMYNRFGPLNSGNGYRRLNVAVTRAREKIMCVSSMKATDIHNTQTKGALLLKKYLEYAEVGARALYGSRLIQDQSGIQADSEFEEEVEIALTDRGFKVHRQVGVSGFKIDLSILNPKNLEEYILGIECDGATYHSSYSARMNDRKRQDILERLGWKIYRIWSQHWVTHRDVIIDDIVKMVSILT